MNVFTLLARGATPSRWRRTHHRGIAGVVATGALVAAGLAVAPPSAAAGAVPTWTQLSPTASPSSRDVVAMAYFPDIGKTVIFGGDLSTDVRTDETWTFSGNTWTQASPSTYPTARFGASMTYDAANHQLVLFGGRSGLTDFDDTWVYDGTTWTDVSSTVRPTGRYAASMAYDPVSQKVVLFGGDKGGTLFDDTWTFDGSAHVWTKSAATTGPSSRSAASMAYDATTGALVLFGGNDMGTLFEETWTYTVGTNTWSKLTTTASPSGRASAMMTYDPDVGGLLLFGGWNGSSGLLGDTWVFDGSASTWIQRTTTTHPPARVDGGMAFDQSAGKAILFGGSGSGGIYLGDTWTFDLVATAPATPAAPQAEPGDGQVSLYWNAPDDGGSAITGYSVQYKQGDATTWETPVSPTPATARTLTVTGLVNDTTYDFQVRATNTVGDGGWSSTAYATPAVTVASTWTNLVPLTSAVARSSAGMTYDNARGNVVLFGGHTSGGAYLGDTWTWNGTWTQQSPATSPSARIGPALAYDNVMSKDVLFGGLDTGGLTGTATAGDTWTWDGTTWTRVYPATSPSPRQGAAMVFDPQLGRMVLFGGSPGGTTMRNDTWSWDGTTWSQDSPTTSPPARSAASLVYDQARHELVLFGGMASGGGYLADTWTYDGQTWTNQTPSVSPGARVGAAMAYDESSGKVVLYGGTGNLDYADTWTWNGFVWTQMAPAAHPSTRFSATMTFDSASGKLIMFGGATTGAYYDETWTYGPPALTRPATPAAPSLEPRSGQMVVSWTAPDDGGSPVTHYVVRYKASADTGWFEVQPYPLTATTMIVNGLSSSTSYDFQVRAVNDIGASDWSTTSSATTPAPGTVPATPDAPNVVKGDRQVVVSWTAPGDGGSPILRFRVAYKQTTTSTWSYQVVEPPATTATVASLTNGVSYDFKVRAENAVGDGEYSSVVSATPSTIPTVPGSPTLTAGNGHVLVEWSAPADGGSAITGYTVAYRPSGGHKWSTVTSADTSEDITGLTNHVQYVFKVLATNASGSSAYSPEAAATPYAALAPATPLDVSGVAQTSADGRSMDVTLTWTDGGYASADHEVTIYAYRLSGKGVPTYRVIGTVRTGSGGSTYTVIGLSPRKVYAFSVAAGNADGWSVPSVPSGAVGG